MSYPSLVAHQSLGDGINLVDESVFDFSGEKSAIDAQIFERVVSNRTGWKTINSAIPAVPETES